MTGDFARIEATDNGYIVELNPADIALAGQRRRLVYSSLSEALYELATWIDPKVIQLELMDTRVKGTTTVSADAIVQTDLKR